MFSKGPRRPNATNEGMSLWRPNHDVCQLGPNVSTNMLETLCHLVAKVPETKRSTHLDLLVALLRKPSEKKQLFRSRVARPYKFSRSPCRHVRRRWPWLLSMTFFRFLNVLTAFTILGSLPFMPPHLVKNACRERAYTHSAGDPAHATPLVHRIRAARSPLARCYIVGARGVCFNKEGRNHDGWVVQRVVNQGRREQAPLLTIPRWRPQETSRRSATRPLGGRRGPPEPRCSGRVHQTVQFWQISACSCRCLCQTRPGVGHILAISAEAGPNLANMWPSLAELGRAVQIWSKSARSVELGPNLVEIGPSLVEIGTTVPESSKA